MQPELVSLGIYFSKDIPQEALIRTQICKMNYYNMCISEEKFYRPIFDSFFKLP